MLVLRNAGGRVTEEIINEIAFIVSITESLMGDNASPIEVAAISDRITASGHVYDIDTGLVTTVVSAAN